MAERLTVAQEVAGSIPVAHPNNGRTRTLPLMSASPIYRAGASIEDFCRVCKTDRLTRVIAVDAEGRPIRVSCGFCHSDHNFRGGPRVKRLARSAGSIRRRPARAA